MSSDKKGPLQSQLEAARLGHVPRTVVFLVLDAQLTGKVVSGTQEDKDPRSL